MSGIYDTAASAGNMGFGGTEDPVVQDGTETAGETGIAEAESSQPDETGLSGENLKTEDRAGESPKPDSPEGYLIEIPEGGEEYKALSDPFRKAAFEAGLNQQQVTALSGMWHQVVAEHEADSLQTAQSRSRQTEKALRTEWGGDYEKNLALSKRGLKKLGDPEFQKLVETSGFGDLPEVIRFCLKADRLMGEDSYVEGAPAPREIPRTGGGTPMLNFPSMEK